MEQERAAESPDAWFRRVMRAKKLSPLDLGDIFAFGDAGVYSKVPLSHMCEVMFDLDPESGGGEDPVSERMEVGRDAVHRELGGMHRLCLTLSALWW